MTICSIFGDQGWLVPKCTLYLINLSSSNPYQILLSSPSELKGKSCGIFSTSNLNVNDVFVKLEYPDILEFLESQKDVPK
jgi:hypothetical protein